MSVVLVSDNTLTHHEEGYSNCDGECRLPEEEEEEDEKGPLQPQNESLDPDHSFMTIPSNLRRAPPKIPVDPQWLQKLLRRHSSTPSDHTIPAWVCAPMVDQSDLPFRLQCRRYNVNLCYTPMIHAQLFLKSPRYRAAFGIHPNTDAMDRPLVAQICGGTSIDAVVQTALALAPHVDAIDINCGCPQFIAKRGHYGAFLLEDEAFLLPLIHALVAVLPIPLTVKVRLLPHPNTAAATATTNSTGDTEANPPPPPPHDLAASLRLYERLIDAGVHGLGVHGRTRHQKGPLTGPADVEALRQVVSAFSQQPQQIPILVNGNVASRANAERLLDYTGAAGVLSAEALLEYPALFLDGVPPPSRKELALEYMQLARDYPPDRCGQGSPALKIVKMHVHRLGHMYLGGDARRQQLIDAETMAQVAAVVESWPDTDAVPGALSWYYRHRGDPNHAAEGATVLQERQARERTVAPSELLEDAGDCFAQLFLQSEDDDDE